MITDYAINKSKVLSKSMEEIEENPIRLAGSIVKLS